MDTFARNEGEDGGKAHFKFVFTLDGGESGFTTNSMVSSPRVPRAARSRQDLPRQRSLKLYLSQLIDQHRCLGRASATR